MKMHLITILFGVIAQILAAPVMTWIPPYAVETCQQNLTIEWDGYGPKDGLSHVALQYWVPKAPGQVVFVSRTDYDLDYFSDESIAIIRDWGNRYSIKTMLCFYNGEWGWDWPLAVGAFKTNKDATINALLAEVRRLNLDGVEIDLEKTGGWISASDNNAFVDFLDALGDSLHANGHDLTVAAGANTNLGPDWNLWSSMAPHVDAITSMGYAFIGMNASNYNHQFSTQKAHINDPTKLLLGIPGYSSFWETNTLVEHLTWIRDDSVVGVAIWDLQLNQVGWQKKEPWELLNQIRGQLVTSYIINASSEIGGIITPNGEVTVDSSFSQYFTIIPDEWYIVDSVVVDGINKGNIDNYTFNNVVATHSINAYFKPDSGAPPLYSILTKANENGAISPSGIITVAKGSSKSFTVIPSTGYHAQSFLINDIDYGQIISLTMENICNNYSIEASFDESSGGHLGLYETWKEPHIYTPNDTIYYNDTLWKYQGNEGEGGWGSTMEPSIALASTFGTPPWLFVGLYNDIADSLITADAIYKSSKIANDTLIINTKYIAAGSTYNTKIDTHFIYTIPISSTIQQHSATELLISANGNICYFPNAGTYVVEIRDLRGRLVANNIIKIKKSSNMILKHYYNNLSDGMYILSIVGSKCNAYSKIMIQ